MKGKQTLYEAKRIMNRIVNAGMTIENFEEMCNCNLTESFGYFRLDIGDALKAVRENAELSMEQMAVILDCSVSAINNYEAGWSVPTAKSLKGYWRIYRGEDKNVELKRLQAEILSRLDGHGEEPLEGQQELEEEETTRKEWEDTTVTLPMEKLDVRQVCSFCDAKNIIINEFQTDDIRLVSDMWANVLRLDTKDGDVWELSLHFCPVCGKALR